MYCGKYAPWEHYPKTLRYFEVQHPLNVIIEFFDAAWPGEQEKELKEWRDAVLDDKFYNDGKHGPGTLLYQYDWNIKLLEAMYMLLLDREQIYPRPEAIDETQLAEEKETWYYFPPNLSIDELIDPYKAIKKMFKRVSLPEYHDQLREWLSQALTNRLTAEGIEAVDLVIVYESLLKLYDLAWLIHQRETDQIMLKDEYKVKEQGTENVTIENRLPVPHKNSIMNIAPTPAEKLGLDEVVNLILRTVPSVQMIIHMGTHQRPFTYYILVLVDDKVKTLEHEISNRIEDNCRQLVNVFTMAHKLQSAKDGIVEGKVFWNGVMENGNMVYQSPELSMPNYQVIDSEIIVENAKHDWQRWSVQGKEFLNSAKRFNADHNCRMASFMLHQAVESTLIAIIKVRLGYKLSIHNLLRMLKITLLFTDELMDVFELTTKEGKQIFEPLQNAYSEARYRDAFDPGENDVRVLLEKVDLFVQKAQVLYEQFLRKQEIA